MKVINGWAFPDADRFMVGEMSPSGTYQLSHLSAALKYVTKFGCAVDGGAHVGTWSHVMADVFTRVIAVEPSPDTFESLAWNMAERGHGGTVECRQVALGATPGMVSLVLDAANEARANTGGRHVQKGGSIPIETIDGWGLTDVGLIKLDIEGSEPQALRGAVETLRRERPIVLYESKWLWTRHYGLPKATVSAFLESVGYQHLESVGCDQIWGPA